MKKIKILFLFLGLILTVSVLSSCMFKGLEEKINVVFMYEDEIISSVTVTQFENAKTPSLDDAYIPVGYKFFGWTPFNPDEVLPTAENFKELYIGDGKMVHWSDVHNYAVNSTVILKALIIDKEAIPKVYHYALIAWYDKPATTGISEEMINTMFSRLKEYLLSEGVEQSEIDTLVLRGYTGNVGTSCGNIMNDGDVDIMVGWSSRNNVINTGGMSDDMLLESVELPVGESQTRMIHRLSSSETVLKVFAWLQSDECKAIFR